MLHETSLQGFVYGSGGSSRAKTAVIRYLYLIPFLHEVALNIKMRIVSVIRSEQELLSALLQRNGMNYLFQLSNLFVIPILKKNVMLEQTSTIN